MSEIGSFTGSLLFKIADSNLCHTSSELSLMATGDEVIKNALEKHQITTIDQSPPFVYKVIVYISVLAVTAFAAPVGVVIHLAATVYHVTLHVFAILFSNISSKHGSLASEYLKATSNDFIASVGGAIGITSVGLLNPIAWFFTASPISTQAYFQPSTNYLSTTTYLVLKYRWNVLVKNPTITESTWQITHQQLKNLERTYQLLLESLPEIENFLDLSIPSSDNDDVVFATMNAIILGHFRMRYSDQTASVKAITQWTQETMQQEENIPHQFMMIIDSVSHLLLAHAQLPAEISTKTALLKEVMNSFYELIEITKQISMIEKEIYPMMNRGGDF